MVYPLLAWREWVLVMGKFGLLPVCGDLQQRRRGRRIFSFILKLEAATTLTPAFFFLMSGIT